MRRGFILIAVVACLAGISLLAAQPRADDPIRELLTEVRGLRQALERTNVVGARIQLLVARLQLQEQRVAETSRRLQDSRNQLTGTNMGISEMSRRLREIENMTSRLSAEERAQAEQEAEMIKGQIESQETRQQQLTSEEGLLSQQLSTEQGRWEAFNARLEELERSLK